MVLEIGGEDWGVQARLGVVKECLLGSWRDSVQAAESKTKQAIGLRLGRERIRDGGGDLDGLVGHRQAPNGDLVGINLSTGR